MTSDNPVTARLTRGIDQGRMRRLNRIALVTGIVINVIPLMGMIVYFSVDSSAFEWLLLLLVLPMAGVGVFALCLLTAGLAAQMTHHKISGEGGDILLLTPVGNDAIAGGFINGITRCLVWAQWFATGLMITAGLAGGFVGLVVFLTLVGPSFNGSAPLLPLWILVSALLVGGIPAAGIADGMIRWFIQLSIRAGVATAFWQRDRDAASVRGIATGLMLGILLLTLIGCSLLIWLPLWMVTGPWYPISGCGTVAAVVIGLILSFTLSREVNAWFQRLLLRSIERAKSRR
jgi:hypothetical protein